MALRAGHEALTHDVAGAKSDLGLQYVVAGTQGVALRIEECEDALFLIAVKQHPSDRERGKAGQEHQRKLPDAHTGREKQDTAT